MSPLNAPPAFEDANDTFIGMTKPQFAVVGSLLSLLAAGLACLALVVSFVVASRHRHDFCKAVDTVNSSIRVVLETGIRNGEAELKDPKFRPFRKQIIQGIQLDQKFVNELFANKPC